MNFMEALAVTPGCYSVLASLDGERWFAIWGAPGADVDLIARVTHAVSLAQDELEGPSDN